MDDDSGFAKSFTRGARDNRETVTDSAVATDAARTEIASITPAYTANRPGDKHRFVVAPGRSVATTVTRSITCILRWNSALLATWQSRDTKQDSECDDDRVPIKQTHEATAPRHGNRTNREDRARPRNARLSGTSYREHQCSIECDSLGDSRVRPIAVPGACR
jgi:hypothetical protein